MKIFKLLILALLITGSGCAYLGYLKDPFVDIANFRKVKSKIYSGGLPKKPGLQLLTDLKIKTIVSFREEIPEHESSFIKDKNINFVKIPISIYKRPSDHQILHFLETMMDENNLPIYLHCNDGRDRTGAMIAIYRTVVDGLGPKKAYKEALKYGFWPYRGDDILKNYIHQLKDKPHFFEFAREYKSKEENGL